MTDDFSNHPKSVTEIRSDKSMDPRDWTVRDALISLLRDIDNGTQQIDSIAIGWKKQLSDRDEYETGITIAGCNGLEAVGILEHAKRALVEESYES